MPTPCTEREPSMLSPAQNAVCSLCGGQGVDRLWEGSDKKFRGPGRFLYVRCRGCGLVFLHPSPSDQEMAQYYPDHVTAVLREGQGTALETTRQWLKRVVAEDWYGYVTRHQTSPVRLLRKALTLPFRPFLSQVPRQCPDGRVLDIGCGSGGYLAFLATLGWTCHGIEPGPKSRAYAQEVLGLTVHQGPLESCRFPEAFFDVVTMWHVIEHLPDPLGTLREVRRILKPDGLLMLRTPNVASWEARVFRGNWYGLDPPRHLFVCSPDTLRAMLARSGFVVTRLRYQYHFVDCSRSLLYVLKDRGLPGSRHVAARGIQCLELALLACAPLRRILGQGGAMHVDARRAGS